MRALPSTELPAPTAADGICRVIHAGMVPYREAWDWQVRIADEVREGCAPAT